MFIEGYKDEDVIYVCAHTHTGMLFSHKTKFDIFSIWDNVDRPKVYYAKWNKSNAERKTLYDLTSIWNLKTNKCDKRERDSFKQRRHR